MNAFMIRGAGVLKGQPADACGLSEDLPDTAEALVAPDFDVKQRLGKKGTSFYDRATALAVVACQEALRSGGITVDDSTRNRIGVVLGTTIGSFRSTSDYSRDTLVQEKPYLVNPVLFPNTIMNCAAGQSAIRFGLRGVNATVAGGPLAFHHALRFARHVLRRGAADMMLVGAVEEFSPHRAWNTHLTTGGPCGEGAAVFVLQAADAAQRSTASQIVGLATGFGRGESSGAALIACVRRAMAALPAGAIRVVATCSDREYAPVTGALGHDLPHLPIRGHDAVGGAFGLAALLERPADDPGGLALLTAMSPDGGVAAAVVRGAA